MIESRRLAALNSNPVQKSMPIVAMWAVPRSVSTAFERMFMEREDFDVAPEPFFACYYFGPGRISQRYDTVANPPGASRQWDWESVLRALRKRSRKRPLFTKNMAYQVSSFASERFLRNFQNTFIIRHPKYVLPSLLRIQPDTTYEEVGYAEQYRLMLLVETITGHKPPVVDGEALRENPPAVVEKYCADVGIPYLPDTLRWETAVQDGWDEEWTRRVASSRGFLAAEPPDQEYLEHPIVRRFMPSCIELYEEMSKRIPSADSREWSCGL